MKTLVIALWAIAVAIVFHGSPEVVGRERPREHQPDWQQLPAQPDKPQA